MGNEERCKPVAEDAAGLRAVVLEKLADISASASGEFPVLSGHLWLGGEEVEATAEALAPKLRKARKTLEGHLFDVVALEVREVKGFAECRSLSGRSKGSVECRLRVWDTRDFGAAPLRGQALERQPPTPHHDFVAYS